MYQIKSIYPTEYIIYDPRDDELIVKEPKCTLEVNSAGSGSFLMFFDHPRHSDLLKQKAMIDVLDGNTVIFRGKQTADSRDFFNSKRVELEGVLTFLHDSQIPAFNFPDDWAEDAEYITASESGNVVEFFLNWILTQHNSQVQDFQKLQLGNVTVADPNNYITRSSESVMSSWEAVKSKLFDSALGGYLVPRYEADGVTYIDYVSSFTLTNTQEIAFGENLKDFSIENNASSIYTAIKPKGAEIEAEDGTKTVVDISSLSDGDYSSDIVKSGDTLYSKSGVETYGWKYAPVDDAVWDDVTEPSILRTKAANALAQTGLQMIETIEIKAVDLHFTDEQIASFKFGRNINVLLPQGVSKTYPLTKLEIDITRPQNTVIVVGESRKTLTESQAEKFQKTEGNIADIKTGIQKLNNDINEVSQQVVTAYTEIIATANEMILAATETKVDTSTFSEYQQTLQTQLKVMSDNLAIQINNFQTSFNKLDDDFQKLENNISKNFIFTENGLVINQSNSTIQTVIDNDSWTMLADSIEQLRVTVFGVEANNLIIKNTARFGDHIITTESGHFEIEYTGGDE